MAQIIPAILTDDEQEYHDRLLKAQHVSDIIQVDIIDGKFAANTTVGVDTIKKYLTTANLEVQLMVAYPQNYIDDLMFVEHVGRIVIPFEAGSGLPEAIYHIKNHNKQVGLSLNVETPVKAALHLLDDIDFLLLLAVNPGFSGQKLNELVVDKIKEAKNIACGLAVEVDGGVNFENAALLCEAGADFLAANSVLFGAEDFHLAFEKLAKLAS